MLIADTNATAQLNDHPQIKTTNAWRVKFEPRMNTNEHE